MGMLNLFPWIFVTVSQPDTRLLLLSVNFTYQFLAFFTKDFCHFLWYNV